MPTRNRAAVALLLVTAAVLASRAGGTTSPGGGNTSLVAPARLTCYGAQFTGFKPRRMEVSDGVSGDLSVDLYVPDEVCAPAAGVDGKVAETGYLTCYKIRSSTSFPVERARVADEFRRSATVLLVRPYQLCLPSSRADRETLPTISRPPDIHVCYSAKPIPLLARPDVSIADSFGKSADAIRGPFRLCSAASKRGARPVGAGVLTCYTVESGTKGTSVVVKNEFGFLKAALGPRARLCVRASFTA